MVQLNMKQRLRSNCSEAGGDPQQKQALAIPACDSASVSASSSMSLCSMQTTHSPAPEMSSQPAIISAQQHADSLKDLQINKRSRFSELELQAQCRFVLAHPHLGRGNKKMWGLFKQETGSRRTINSLRSNTGSAAFQQSLMALQGQRTKPLLSSPSASLTPSAWGHSAPTDSSSSSHLARMDGTSEAGVMGQSQSPSPSLCNYDSDETNETIFQDNCCCS